MILYAPKEFSANVSEMMKKNLVYINPTKENPYPYDLEVGFDCWGWCRYLFKLPPFKLDLEDDPFVAGKRFVRVKEPEFGCIVSFKPFMRSMRAERNHVGFMETFRIVSHCSDATFGIARDYLDMFVAPYHLYKLRDSCT